MRLSACFRAFAASLIVSLQSLSGVYPIGVLLPVTRLLSLPLQSLQPPLDGRQCPSEVHRRITDGQSPS